MLVGIVDYGMGNLLSVYHALSSLGVEPLICKSPKDFDRVDRIVLPGVGAFGKCIENLRQTEFFSALNTHVVSFGKPFFGICLGMQALATQGFEGGTTTGLGWLEAEARPLDTSNANLRVPHIGWNNIDYDESCPLFKGIGGNPDVYFVHSYHLISKTTDYVVATTNYGQLVTSAVLKDNVFATQFHPEKSQTVGLKILSNFLTWNP